MSFNKIIASTLIFFAFFNFALSQNLVPNGSFEEYSECPEIQGDFEVDNWYYPINHSGTADFFHTCSNGIYGVPDSLLGTQTPNEGNAYAGIACFNNFSFELREYIQVELINPLFINQFYEVSFFVSLADSRRIAVSHIGAAFSNTAIEGNNTLDHLFITPQVFTNNVISDKENWTKVSGIFQANGGESYLTIGVFFSDQDISTIELLNGEDFLSYYFIDSVSVIESDKNASEQSCLKILNPVYDTIYLHSSFEIQSLDIVLFDISGKRINKNIIDNEIYVGDLSDGVYIINYKCGIGRGYKKIIKM